MLVFLTEIVSFSWCCVELDSADGLVDLFDNCRVYVRLLMIEVCSGGDDDGVTVTFTIFSLRPIFGWLREAKNRNKRSTVLGPQNLNSCPSNGD